MLFSNGFYYRHYKGTGAVISGESIGQQLVTVPHEGEPLGRDPRFPLGLKRDIPGESCVLKSAGMRVISLVLPTG